MTDSELKSSHVSEMERVDRTKVDVLPQQVAPKPTLYMTVFSVVIGFAGWMYNFDLGFSGIVLLMPPYNRTYGSCREVPSPTGELVTRCALSPLQQSFISLAIIFIGIGSLLGGYSGHYLGRRGTVQIGCVVIAIGAGGMIGSSGNFVAYIVCKCIQGVGLGQLLSAVSSYGVECVAAEKRGLLMALVNVGLGFGNMVAAAVCLGSSKFTTNASWQTPISCQIPLAVLLAVVVAYFPESPRWLLVKGREEDARRSFARFYSKSPDSPEVAYQVQAVLHYLEIERAMEATSSWTEIFRGIDLKRTLTSTVIAVGTAITGSKFITTYGAIFLAGVGIKNPYHITLTLGGASCVGCIISPVVIEYIGRRMALLVGYGGMSLCMVTFAIIGSALGQTSSGVKIVMVVLLCLWAVLYGGFIGTSLSTTSAEMHSVRLRTYGQALSIAIYEIFSFGASFSTPYMISADYGNMGMNVGYFFFGVTVLIWVLIFFLVPETGRLTLEDIDDVFMSRKKPWKTSLSGNKRQMALRVD